MYLDRHDIPGVSPEELAAAHEADLAAQDGHGVRYHTYWFDPGSGAVFCLAEGPTADAIAAVHREAHGQLANTIIELDHTMPLNTLLGALPMYPPGTAYTASAVRTIVFTDVCGSVEQTQALGDDGHLALLREHNAIVRRHLSDCDGREVKHTGDGIMAAFDSVSAAVTFGTRVQAELHERNASGGSPLHVSIGINAGEPVTDDSDDLFGAAVQIAARLCAVAGPGDIAVSVAVRELCHGKPFVFSDREPVHLKGMREATRFYTVDWSELATN
jgi:class 3 adenylate cyclase